MMKNHIFGALMALILALGAFAPLAAEAEGSKNPAQEAIRIGGGFALTGGEAGLDGPAANGARLAAKEITAAGGVLGRPLELIVRDSHYQMDATRRIARQLIEEDRVVGLVGFADTDSVLAFAPIAQQAGVPFITTGASSPKLPQQVGDLLFLACFGDNVQAAAGAEFAARQFGKTAYLLWNEGVNFTTLLAGYFKARFVELGGVIVGEASYADQTKDFSAYIDKIKALPKPPDLYYVAAMPYDIGAVAQQFRAAGLNGPIVGGDGYDDPAWVAAAGAAANNVYFSTHALNDGAAGSPGYRRFFAAYQQEYGQPPENAFAGLGYDAVYLLADAIRRAGSTEGRAIRQALEATKDFPGVTGSITYGPGVQVPRKGVTMIALKEGRYTLGAEVVPEKVPAP